MTMIDLSEVSTKELKEELKRRKIVEREARKQRNEGLVRCKNCAFRIPGQTNYGALEGYDSWVCYKKPKQFKTYFNNGPQYTKAYYACSPAIKGCRMFVNKNSEEGIKIRQKLSMMADRIS